jgi:hypothetical protein
MNPTEKQIVNAMTEYGGSFVQALANAFRKADDGNAERIRLAFPEIWNIYTNLARLKYEPHSKD